MKKILLFITTLNLTVIAQADIFQDYQNQGLKALENIKTQPEKTDLIVNQINAMIDSGFEIMNLFELKFNECKIQFNEVKQAKESMANLSYSEIERLYHDGQGLTPASRNCYKGRSLVVHPYQVIALAKENRLKTDIEIIEHEMNEVIERAEKIKALLK